MLMSLTDLNLFYFYVRPFFIVTHLIDYLNQVNCVDSFDYKYIFAFIVIFSLDAQLNFMFLLPIFYLIRIFFKQCSFYFDFKMINYLHFDYYLTIEQRNFACFIFFY
jgi:hypothetical protein